MSRSFILFGLVVLEVPNGVSLGVIAAALALSVVASLKWPSAATT